ncbi:alpha/beta fold hydrolase [Labrys monachus]|uniref:Lysophospholipase n=1 Tax=Labrys monachus TaxID=217067 RepID=A0ABU0FQ19_9HYPH|nr:alpha/beta hydrolase [Labrys monachus]MDQ0396153.1 lysophospholipase [Labrys monachus]
MPLFDCPENPCPAGAVVEMIKARDGITLRTARWASLSPRPKGTVCLFQGRSEFIEKYFEVIRDLRARGFAVATLDWRGQGGSDRLLSDPRLGHIGDFRDFGRDVEAFVRQIALPECPPPFYGLAHSMGAAILFDTLPPGASWFERLAVTAPMIDIGGKPPAARLTARVLSLAGLSERIVPGWSPHPVALKPFLGNPVTSDPLRYGRAAIVAERAPALAIGGPTIGWVRAAFVAMDRLLDPRFGADWRIPVLAFLAGEDRVVSSSAAEHFTARLRASRTLTLPGARHEIMQERDDIRNAFWAAFDAFVPGSQP